MKTLFNIVCLVGMSIFLLAACGPRPQYKTSAGKKKLKYYNSIQYNQKNTPKTFKSPKRR